MITNELIIECAKSNGFTIPNKSFNYLGKTIHVTESDIGVHRAKIFDLLSSRDLGEWWLSYIGSVTVFIVTDNDMTIFLRDQKIKNILK